MKITINIVAAVGIGIMVINECWTFQLPFLLIVLEEK